ncbi:MAG: hypothetical protein VX911_03670 [Candidatus Latescibacterota bacterium]|nr:hypothetical protein [Candidatus Latescibacterota bacterium]
MELEQQYEAAAGKAQMYHDQTKDIIPRSDDRVSTMEELKRLLTAQIEELSLQYPKFFLGIFIFILAFERERNLRK